MPQSYTFKQMSHKQNQPKTIFPTPPLSEPHEHSPGFWLETNQLPRHSSPCAVTGIIRTG